MQSTLPTMSFPLPVQLFPHILYYPHRGDEQIHSSELKGEAVVSQSLAILFSETAASDLEYLSHWTKNLLELKKKKKKRKTVTLLEQNLCNTGVKSTQTLTFTQVYTVLLSLLNGGQKPSKPLSTFIPGEIIRHNWWYLTSSLQHKAFQVNRHILRQ